MKTLPPGSYTLTQNFVRNNEQLANHSLNFKKNGPPTGGTITMLNKKTNTSSSGAIDLKGTGMTDEFQLSTDGWSDDFSLTSELK